MVSLDLLVKNVRVVRHDRPEPESLDIGIVDGRIARLEPAIDAAEAREVVDGGGKLAFPCIVDAHQHWGIYNPLGEDAETESRACAQGGVTTSMTSMRTGQYYLNKGGSTPTSSPRYSRRWPAAPTSTTPSTSRR